MSQKPKIEKTKAQWGHIRRTYGLTEEQYHALWTGACPICLRLFSDAVRPVVDHDHKTGEVRGVLCFYCNHRVVGRHRDADLMSRVAEYLRGPHSGHMIPKKKRKKRGSRSKRKN